MALAYFADLKPEHRTALYALRCSFAHEFALFNASGRPGLTHHFRVHNSLGSVVVCLPPTPWNGDRRHPSFQNVTEVNLRAFGDLVENICGKLWKLANEGCLEVAMDGGVQELYDRYVIAAW